jgi:hypothetical protein
MPLLEMLRPSKPSEFCEELARLKDGAYKLVVQRSGKLAFLAYEGSVNIKLAEKDGEILFTIVPVDRARK